MADNAGRPSQQPPRSQPPSTEAIDDDWAAEDAPVQPVAAAAPPRVASVPPRPPPPREARPEPAEVVLLPPALESAVAQTIPVREAPSSAARRRLPVPMMAGVAVAAAAAVWVAFGGRAGDEPEPHAVAAAPTPPVRVLPARPAPEAPALPGTPTSPKTPSSVPELPATPAASQPGRSPAQGAVSEAPVGAAAAGEVLVRLSPDDAKLYRKGKRVGGSGTVLRLEAGERLAFEVVKRGYATRKLVVDGSERAVHVVLRPDPAATP